MGSNADHSLSPIPRPTTKAIGQIAEDLVAQWLIEQGWEILHRHWHCRWGELDLVASYSSQPEPGSTLQKPVHRKIAFVEVKARSRGNWDQDGLLAVNRTKQTKLLQTAHLYLSTYPDLADYPCQFDVALVSCQRSKRAEIEKLEAKPVSSAGGAIAFGKPVYRQGYYLTLHHYLASAFDE